MTILDSSLWPMGLTGKVLLIEGEPYLITEFRKNGRHRINFRCRVKALGGMEVVDGVIKLNDEVVGHYSPHEKKLAHRFVDDVTRIVVMQS